VPGKSPAYWRKSDKILAVCAANYRPGAGIPAGKVGGGALPRDRRRGRA